MIEEILARLIKIKIFTKLDIRQAFYRIKIKESVENLIIFRIRYGLYKYKILFFGLYNSPVFFQRYINNVLFDCLNNFCIVYVDDIFIYLEDPKNHEIQIKKVLQRFRKTNLQTDIKKNEFDI